jgi:hypothetical protein
VKALALPLTAIVWDVTLLIEVLKEMTPELAFADRATPLPASKIRAVLEISVPLTYALVLALESEK